MKMASLVKGQFVDARTSVIFSIADSSLPPYIDIINGVTGSCDKIGVRFLPGT
jgi:hypothetical protein